MVRKHTSWVYQLIRLDPESKQRYCTICPADSGALKCGNNDKGRPNTSNLEYHLMKHHEDIARDTKQRHMEEVRLSTTMKKRHLGDVTHRQATIKEHLARHHKWQVNDSKAQLTNEILTDFIVGSNQPINILENPFFVRLMDHLKPLIECLRGPILVLKCYLRHH